MKLWQKEAIQLILICGASAGIGLLILYLFFHDAEKGYESFLALPDRRSSYIEIKANEWEMGLMVLKPAILLWGLIGRNQRDRGWGVRNGVWLIFSVWWVLVKIVETVSLTSTFGISQASLLAKNNPEPVALFSQTASFRDTNILIAYQFLLWVGWRLAMINLAFAVNQILRPQKPLI